MFGIHEYDVQVVFQYNGETLRRDYRVSAISRDDAKLTAWSRVYVRHPGANILQATAQRYIARMELVHLAFHHR